MKLCRLDSGLKDRVVVRISRLQQLLLTAYGCHGVAEVHAVPSAL